MRLFLTYVGDGVRQVPRDPVIGVVNIPPRSKTPKIVAYCLDRRYFVWIKHASDTPSHELCKMLQSFQVVWLCFRVSLLVPRQR